MSKKKEVEFIVNPIAGTKSKDMFNSIIQQNLDHEQFSFHISFTKESGHAFELASQAVVQGKEYVVAVGGDGTVNETARALINEDTALGIIPFGSGNGLARHLNIPLMPSLAVQLINRQQILTIDGGKANGKPFFCTAGIGFDAHVGEMFSLATTRGFFTYVKTVLKEFFQYKPNIYWVAIDGAEAVKKEAFSITFANAGQYGNNAYISPQADITDGKLDLCLLNKYPKRVGLHMGFRLFNGSIHKSRFMTITPIKKATVVCNDAKSYHIDGEFIQLKGNLEVEIIPQCLNVLV